ncbi:GntR family transcriptional regulator [Sphingomonas sp. Leaf357]|uniref:FadR/GntR family transcriptional regulator n=1 Tax=Sphingomonas sp. Leaf357 TaxID=1736350 RepID=UPI000701D695|nr:FadR/GntR family transcriptional regulator [Sphingomonas sp. Leaf357]KQS04964.1 GntR family transcriptional regulator [Sphingomonas sp. Leaf357]
MNVVSAIGGSLVDQAVRRVRDHIRSNNLKPGDTLPGEGHFAADLGVSRAVMREAFGALAALRQIDVANGRRARVAAIDGMVMSASLDHAVATAQISVADVWDVRRTLELRTAELAARNRSGTEARLITDLAAAMIVDRNDLAARTRHDIAFHQAIAQASGNALFLQIVRSFEALMLVAVPTAWRTRTDIEQQDLMLAHHQSIASAIADRDPIAATAMMDAHFDESISDLFNQPRS